MSCAHVSSVPPVRVILGREGGEVRSPSRAFRAVMRPIALVRFNALAGYCRRPPTLYYAEELAWFEHGGERVLGTIIRDRTDDDFAGVVLARDRLGRFRAVALTGFEPSQRRAEVLLRQEMEHLSLAPEKEYYQGDESGTPLDFFTPRAARERLSGDFLKVAAEESFSAARGIIEPMMHWYEDPDGNFIEQFQTTGFDARLWELYLFATFVEMGYQIDRIHAAPDFTCVGVLGEFAVEAMTVNATRDETGGIVPAPPSNTPEQVRAFLREYMPIKFGSTLTSKLAKKYWEKPNVSGKPLLFAIQDFSAPTSMVFTATALPIYLYGFDYDWEHDTGGQLKISPRKVVTHRWGDKEIPSGFFDLPGSENISSVVFSNSGTISKFSRMGVLAGFGSPRVLLVRQGCAVNHDPNAVEPRAFRHLVNVPGYAETWIEGLNVFHNPRAKHPIEPWMLPGAGHHRLLPDGRMESLTPDWHPLGSFTYTLIMDNDEEARRAAVEGVPEG